MFNKETEYALRSLVYIQCQNNQGLRPGIEEIATAAEAPQSFTAKILQRLVRIGFINSIKGKGGGFYFEKDKPDLPLKELIVAIEGDSLFNKCGFGMKNCNCENPCPIHNDYGVIRDGIEKLVTDETIQSLANKLSKDVFLLDFQI